MRHRGAMYSKCGFGFMLTVSGFAKVVIFTKEFESPRFACKLLVAGGSFPELFYFIIFKQFISSYNY
jgi:hypothetical protein